MFLLVGSYMQFRAALSLSFWLILGATLTYLIGTFGVTVFGNAPMNEALDAINLGDKNTEALNNIRTSYEGTWNQWHSIRTVFSVLAFILCLLAAVIDSNNDKSIFLIFKHKNYEKQNFFAKILKQ